ncbi:uncharacterized protein A4U43_C08F12960 [Asparagus officinalis]|uniref:uncharacterized protein LOC109822806 n=1 Tax=Asparagus officinalis TaxID=4686 RepID=UPI00098E195A|nr:uncharacterized protein LOC109822806 [Asparagus officinalis]ONK59981.1 uncharacterized protein A4U43_C08F12960 [Asparagus officinalis]
MAQQAHWETFSDEDDDDGNNSNNDDALSLSDLPVGCLAEKQATGCKPSEALEDFEFRTCGNGLLLKPGPAAEAHMCVADDIFFKGQLLPLKSCSSQSDRSLSSNSVSSTSNCSSSSVSRSQSSSSHSSNCDAPRLSISNKFYAHPSPRPQVIRTNISSGRKSTGSAPPRWALLRLGVVKTPEIELNGLKLRRLRSNESKCEPKAKKSGPRFGFGCKCAPDVTEPVLIRKKKVDAVIGYEKRESICKSSRMFEWLEELSIGKGSASR